MNFISLIVVILALCALVDSALDPIPEDIKNKLTGNWYEDYFYGGKRKRAECAKNVVTFLMDDALSVITSENQVNNEKIATYTFIGKRDDDGSTLKYQWRMGDEKDTGSFEIYTLLAVTERYAVMKNMRHDKNAEENKIMLYVYSKNKTYSKDDKKAIEKIEKDNGFNIELSPEQNDICEGLPPPWNNL